MKDTGLQTEGNSKITRNAQVDMVINSQNRKENNGHHPGYSNEDYTEHTVTGVMKGCGR